MRPSIRPEIEQCNAPLQARNWPTAALIVFAMNHSLLPLSLIGRRTSITRVHQCRLRTERTFFHLDSCPFYRQKKGPVLLSTSQAQPGRTFSQLSNLSFARLYTSLNECSRLLSPFSQPRKTFSLVGDFCVSQVVDDGGPKPLKVSWEFVSFLLC